MRHSRLKLTAVLLLAVVALSDSAYAQKKVRAPKDFTLNLKDVEITDFLNMMGSLLKKNIVYDEQVRGKVTITSSRKIPLSEAYDVMISILSVKGYTVVETPNLLRVVPIREAPKGDSSIIVDGKPIDFGDDRNVVYIQAIENADINEISRVLTAMKTNNMNIILYPPMNSILFSGTAGEVASFIKIAKALDVKKEEGPQYVDASGLIHVVHLHNAKAEDLAAILSKVPTRSTMTQGRAQPQQGNQPAGQQLPLSIIASKETNSLIITCMPDEFIELKKIIDQLDTVRDQILIEAIIMEVSADKSLDFGIDWLVGQSKGKQSVFGNSVLGGVPSSTTANIYGQKASVFPGFSLGYLYNGSILGFALLSATAEDSSVNILSTPQIMTLDNQEAVIYAGEEIPIPSTNKSSSGDTLTYSFEYKSVGLKLKVTPHITQDDRITLDLYQEVNQLIGQATQIGDSYIPPEIGKRDLTTKVTVLNGKTIVVGGLIRDDRKNTEYKVPILGDIPLLGWLFKNKQMEHKKTNLMIFITPTVVTKREALEEISARKMEEQKNSGLKK